MDIVKWWKKVLRIWKKRNEKKLGELKQKVKKFLEIKGFSTRKEKNINKNRIKIVQNAQNIVQPRNLIKIQHFSVNTVKKSHK